MEPTRTLSDRDMMLAVGSLAASSAMLRNKSSPSPSAPEVSGSPWRLSPDSRVCICGRAGGSKEGEASLEPAMRSTESESERMGVCCLGQVPDALIGGPRDVSP